MAEESLPGKALVLGSGAARGVAHVGVINALEDHNLRPDMVVGTSMGAVVGAAYAAGRLPELSEFMQSLDWRSIITYCDFSFPQQGLLDGAYIMNQLKELVGDIQFSDLEIPFYAVATDMKSGEPVIFREGSVIVALRASLSVPGIFKPAQLNDHWYLDGGIVAPLPIRQALELGAENIIAVDLNHHQIQRNSRPRRIKGFDRKDILKSDVSLKNNGQDASPSLWNHVERRYKTVEQSMRLALYNMVQSDNSSNNFPNIFDVLGNSMTIMEHNLSKITLEQFPPDILIQPRLSHLNFFDFDKAPEAIKTGYHATRDKIKEKPELFSQNESQSV